MTENVQKFGGLFRPFAMLMMCSLVASSAWGGFRDGKDAYDRGDYATALSVLQPLAAQGHAMGQYQLGIMYYFGYGVEEDDAEAMKWFRKAAEQGHAMAQNHLGDMYYYGYGVEEDHAEAVKWFRKAEAQGHAEAQFNLGVMYAKGYGVEEDDAEAVKWFREAAEQGHAKAQFSLGAMYSDGYGAVQKDVDEAVKWFRRAAAQGDSKAQYILGYMYENGAEVPKDSVEAHRWFTLAAAWGEDLADYKRDEVAKKMTDAQLAEAKRRARDGLKSRGFYVVDPRGRAVHPSLKTSANPSFSTSGQRGARPVLPKCRIWKGCNRPWATRSRSWALTCKNRLRRCGVSSKIAALPGRFFSICDAKLAMPTTSRASRSRFLSTPMAGLSTASTVLGTTKYS